MERKPKFKDGELVRVKRNLDEVDKEDEFEVGTNNTMESKEGKIVKLNLPQSTRSDNPEWRYEQFLYRFDDYTWKESFFEKVTLRDIFK